MCPFLGIVCYPLLRCFFGALGAIFRAALLPAGYTHRIKRATYYVITHAGEVFYTTTADEHNRVLLQVVTNAWNVSRDFNTIGQANSSNLAQRRVWLFRRLGVNARANTTLLRTPLQCGAGRLVPRPLTAITH